MRDQSSRASEAFERTRGELRKRLTSVRRAFPRDRAAAASHAITARVLEMEVFRKAQCVGLYAAVRGEVDPAEIARNAVERGKTVVYPRVTGVGAPLEFAACAPEELRAGAFGIPEPSAEVPSVAFDRIELLLVPGVAFDVRGSRLGSGKGYYDRTLGPDAEGGSRPVTIGLAFEFQIVPEIPEAPLDRRVDRIVTEERALEAASDGIAQQQP